MTETHYAADDVLNHPSSLAPHDDYDEALRGLDAVIDRVHAIMHKLANARQAGPDKVFTYHVDSSVTAEHARR
ncbi:MAG: hypothetical protein EOO77_09920 [Oxalobacteraceae bacterium]|nr:MAG: hypothetical protein EOO77_09920 [Oxalobacteraceae bacterium]